VTSGPLSLEVADVSVPNKAFKRVVRELEFDVAELALMTFLMARSRNVPLRLLPVVVFSRNPLPHLVQHLGRERFTPDQLRGRRVGVRGYTTTTAAWIRALLADQFGVDWQTIRWVTIEDSHVAGVPDPPTAVRADATSDLIAMLEEGAIDAAIVDRVPPDPLVAPVVPDPERPYAAWRHRHDALTLNHVIVVRESIARDARLVRELFDLFRRSREQSTAGDRVSTPLGPAANRRNLDVAITAAEEQGLLARPLSVDDLWTQEIAALP
jgi:4,5-dihydroxyphthalate decarboxylase